MKNLLKIFLISSSLIACQGAGENRSETAKADSSHAILPPDSLLYNDNKTGAVNNNEPGEFERETMRQVTFTLLSSKAEINKLRVDISDSLTQSGLPEEKRSLFETTIEELEASSKLINKQLGRILSSDLKGCRDKLDVIVKKMKGSEKQLGSMITRLNKITGYFDIASSLIQSLLPATGVPVKTAASKAPN